MLARAEFRRQKLSVRLKNEEHRVEEEEAETRVKLKAMREHHKKWEGTRDKRINSWRDFASNKKAKKSKPLGGIKPPKLKMEDEDRTFVQRSAVEQFKAAGKFTAPKPHREED
jgi:DnaJ family protein C protein 8